METEGRQRLSAMLTISDVARRYGLTLRALRFYEDRGLVSPLRHGNARFYDDDSCRRIDVILRAKRLGYTLTTIAAMLSRKDAGTGNEFVAEPEEVDAQIDRLEQKRHELDAALADLRAMQARARDVSQTQTSAA